MGRRSWLGGDEHKKGLHYHGITRRLATALLGSAGTHVRKRGSKGNKRQQASAGDSRHLDCFFRFGSSFHNTTPIPRPRNASRPLQAVPTPLSQFRNGEIGGST